MTIEPNNRKFPFCHLSNGKIELSEIGKIINDQWKWLFDHYDHIRIDEYIIMPDHMHGIIKILPDLEENRKGEISHDNRLDVRATLESPSRPREAPEPPVHLRHNHSKRLDLSHIIGAFKTTSSKLIHKAGYQDYKWKRSFNDRILRNDELEIKRQYIKNNPLNWKKHHRTDTLLRSANYGGQA